MRSLTAAARSFPRRRLNGIGILGAVLALATSAGAAGAVFALTQEEEGGWPREISVPEAEIVVYQPQPDSLVGDRVSARAAVAVTPAGSDEAAFGTVWLGSRLKTDRDYRTAEILETKVLRVGFPNATEEQKSGRYLKL